MRLVKNAAKMLGNGEIGGCFSAAKNGCDKTPPSFLHLSGFFLSLGILKKQVKNAATIGGKGFRIPGCTQIWDDFVAFIGIVVDDNRL